MRRAGEHLIYYFSILGLLVAGVLLILYLSPNRSAQLIVAVGMAVSYSVLGIIHHFLSHDLVLKIVVEYILIALLGLSAIFFILKGGFGF